jgi:hypothetical protein
MFYTTPTSTTIYVSFWIWVCSATSTCSTGKSGGSVTVQYSEIPVRLKRSLQAGSLSQAAYGVVYIFFFFPLLPRFQVRLTYLTGYLYDFKFPVELKFPTSLPFPHSPTIYPKAHSKRILLV